MNIGNEIPFCTSCGHHHEQGIKCLICGHVGKSQIFFKMRLRSNEKRSLRFDHFGAFGSPIDDVAIDFISTIRTMSQNSSNGVASSNDSNNNLLWDSQDGQFNHVVSYVGDFPMGCLRYKIVSLNEDNSAFAVVVEKMIVYPMYRRRKLCWQILYRLLAQFSQSIPYIQQLVLILPSNSWLEAKSMDLGFQKVASSTICSYDISTESLLLFVLESSQNLYNIVAYLKSKSEEGGVSS